MSWIRRTTAGRGRICLTLTVAGVLAFASPLALARPVAYGSS